LEKVIALGLLSLYLAQTGSQAEAWVMIGKAIRLGQNIGLQLVLQKRTNFETWLIHYVAEITRASTCSIEGTKSTSVYLVMPIHPRKTT
jgi:hypothetical protein